MAEPDVTVNGKILRMVQATNGNWYGYFADRTQSQLADATQPAASGKGLDFGEFCNTLSDLNDGTGGSSVLFPDTLGVAIASEATVGGVQGTTPISPSTACLPGSIGPFNTNHVVRNSKTLTPEAGSVDSGQIGLDPDAWPIVQLYDFTLTGNVVIVYNQGGGAQIVTLTFTSLSPGFVPDRTLLTPSSQVVFDLTDNQLNIDPTDKDSWTWATTSGGEQMFYQLFDSNGALDADGTAGAVDLIPSIPTFNWNNNGHLTLDVGTTFNLLDNAIHEITVPGDISTAATVGGSIPAGSQPVTFLEKDITSGTFQNIGFSGTNIANIIVSPGASLGSFALISYDPIPIIFTIIAHPLSMTNARIVDNLGNPVYLVTENEQIQTTADVSNNSGSPQPFAFLVQVLDEFGAPVALSWITGNLNDGQSFSPALSWTPASAGTYTVKMLLWSALDDPFALAAPISFQQEVFGNGQIVFSSDRDGPSINYELYTMNSDGTLQTRRTNAAQFDSNPSWSPDGTKIAFDSNFDGDFEIYTMNADGTGVTKLTNNIAFNDISPSWSPDGTQIVFATNRDGNFEIYTMNSAGTGQTNRSNDPANDISPSWSPNGITIAFSSNRSGSGHDIYGMNVDGTGVINISTTSGSDDFDPNWSPDGTKIVFHTQRDSNFEIYKMNSDGSSQTNISNSPTSIDQSPSWSPDGLHIAFTTNRDGNTEVYVMDVDGTAPLNRSNNPTTSDGHPDWGIAPDTFPNIIELDADQYQVNTGGVVTVTDSAANLSPVLIDTVSVHMNSTTDSTGFSVILSEPNVNAGYFVSQQIIFSSAATNAGQNILHAPAGSTVFANYNIPKDSALIVPATGAFGTPDTLRFDPSDLYVQEGSGLIKVIDAAANSNAATIQTITVHVSSVGTPSGFNVPLLEDAINSGTFTTTQAITFTLGSSVTPNRLHVNDPSDTVTATYSSFTPATATIVRPFSPPIETGIPDPTVDIGCSVDTDNDGLCDDMEDQGTHPGLLSIEHPTAAFTYEYGGATCKPLIDDLHPTAADLTAYGSLATTPACPDINTRDIYVEIDYMTNHKPDASALAQVVRAFESAPDPDGSGPIKPGIKLHLQVDEDIGFHQVSIPQSDVAPFDAANPHGGYYQIKQEKFRTAEERSGSLGDKQLILETKRQAFHYALFGHNYNEATGSSGWAEILGNDIMISLGEFERHVGSPSQQAGTLFHEIGHSINLDHGGNVADPRCKPNYNSAMSYAFQFPTFVSSRPLDFSRSAMTQLTESSLQESLGFGRTSPPGLTAVYGGVTGGVALSPVKTAKTNDATMGLVLDGSTLYITDPGNDRVRKITNTFTTTSTFGTTGTTDGLFKSPEGVAVNSTHIIVADSGNNRIQIFLKSDLTFKKKTGTLGTSLGQFNSPEGVGINSTHIIVADTGNDRLQRFSKSLLSPIIVGSSGSGNGQFKSPWAVAFDGSGNLYVVDSGNNRIQKFAPNGVYLDQVGTRGSGPGQFISPRGIAISAGIVYVSDTGNHRIQKFTTSTLDLITPPPSEFGIFGTGNGQFNSTEGVAVGGSPTSYIYVADTGNMRVQKFVTSTLGYDSAYAPTGTSAFKVSVPVPVNFNRVAPSTETVSQAIHVLSGVSGCTVADGSTPITIYGINDWANINLKFRDSNYFSDGQTQDPAALHELTAGDNNQQLSSTIIILNDLIQALEPAEFSDQPAGFALQDSLDIELNNANNFVIADNLNSALALLQGTVQTDVNALPITLEAEDKKVEILSALENAIAAIQSALEPPTISQIYADDDSATTNQGSPVNISVLVNDGSDAGNVISIASFTQGTKGVVTNNGGGILKYTPNAGQFGADSFTYTISNGVGQTDSATVKITIIPVAPSFALKWGSSGTSDGKFNNPTGIDTDSTGKVYVSDSGNNRIQKFSSTGTFDRKWGSSGTTDGKFNNPTGVDVDSTGKVYVADSGNNRIQKFSSTGTFDRKWGSSGTGNGQFKTPNGIGIDLVANKIYVADSDNNRIQKFSSTGTFDIKWGSSGTGNGQFKKPRVAAVDSAGNVYVTDSVNNRIQKFSSTGTFILQWGSSGTTDGKFKNPIGIDVDSAGNVYVADTDNHRIQKFSSTGTFIVKWGSFGTGNGQFKNPIGVAVDSTGNVFIADTGNHRVQKFVP